jgi:hypothetical protein
MGEWYPFTNKYTKSTRHKNPWTTLISIGIARLYPLKTNYKGIAFHDM